MIKVFLFNNKKLKEENKRLEEENRKIKKILKTIKNNMEKTYYFTVQEYEPKNLTLTNCIGIQYNYICNLLYELEEVE